MMSSLTGTPGSDEPGTGRRAPLDAERTRLLFAPRAVAVVGASEQPGNLGGVAIRLMQKFGYPGTIHPVNPRRNEVHGLACVPRIADLPHGIDLAIFATGAETIAPLIRECAAAGIRAGVAWAGGFAETGREGARLQEALEAVAREAGFALVGPNCIGIINTAGPTIASFASFLTECDRLIPGTISMVSQSGGTATMAQALAQLAGFGFRVLVSTGNEVVLSAADYIHALAGDDGTRVIAAYIEGVRDGDRLIAALAAARAAGKPVVMLKGGQSEASARAALAHTGALAGARRVWEAVLAEQAVIVVHSLEELLDTVLYLGSTDLAKRPTGRGVAVVTFGGGSGVLAADQAARLGLATPRLGEATRERLAPLVPPIASIDNPVDLTPQTFNQEIWFRNFGAALDVIAADPGIGSLQLQFGPQAQRGRETASEVAAFRDRTAKPVALSWPLAPTGVDERIAAAGFYNFPEHARAISALARSVRREEELARAPGRSAEPLAFDWARHVGDPKPGTVVSENTCHALLAAADIAVAPGRLVREAAAAAAAGSAIGWPVAMKGISAAVTHRAAAGLVELAVAGPAQAAVAFERLAARARAADIMLDGIYVQRMIGGGAEVLISAFRDPVFGVMISVGAGGVLTEVLDDVVLARAPVDEAGARDMVGRVRLLAKLAALAGRPDVGSLARYVSHVSRLAASAPYSRFVLEINPVKWTTGATVAVDGLLLIEEA